MNTDTIINALGSTGSVSFDEPRSISNISCSHHNVWLVNEASEERTGCMAGRPVMLYFARHPPV